MTSPLTQVPSHTDAELAPLRFGLRLPCDRSGDASVTGYQVVAGTPTGDVLGPPYARAELVAEAGQGFPLWVCNTRPSYGGIGLLENVEIYWKVDNGPVQGVSVSPQITQLPPDYWADSAAYAIPVPASATGVLEVWARVNTSGGSYWMSRDGANFKADIVPSAQTPITFGAPVDGRWAEPSAGGTLVRGGALRLRYDVQRMVAIMGMCDGYRTADYPPGTTAFVSFRDGGGREVLRYAVDASKDAPVEIPASAASVALWFSGSCANPYAQRSAWDSSFGKNFVFPIR